MADRVLRYLKNILVSIDQLINTILNGDPDETISSRAYRLRSRGTYWPSNIINGIFCWQRNHCRANLERVMLAKNKVRNTNKAM